MVHNPLKTMKVTVPYGKKSYGNVQWAAGYHTGVDLAANYDDEVMAIMDGDVIHIGQFGGWGIAYGIHILVKTGDIIVGYCHLSNVHLKNIQDHKVKAGEVIGYAGASGRAHGVHLHLEARKAPFEYGKGDFDPMSLFHPSTKPAKKVAKKAVSKPVAKP